MAGLLGMREQVFRNIDDVLRMKAGGRWKSDPP